MGGCERVAGEAKEKAIEVVIEEEVVERGLHAIVAVLIAA